MEELIGRVSDYESCPTEKSTVSRSRTGGDDTIRGIHLEKEDMSLTRSIKRFLVLSLIALVGLTAFHRYVEGKSTGESLNTATKEYVSALGWIARRMDVLEDRKESTE